MKERIHVDKTAWLRTSVSIKTLKDKRTHLLLAINDAEVMGFAATKDALLSMLRALEETER